MLTNVFLFHFRLNNDKNKYYLLNRFALIPNLFQNNFEEKVAYLESSGSVGLCLGYILGSGLYAIGGYYLPFLFNALALFILSLII